MLFSNSLTSFFLITNTQGKELVCYLLPCMNFLCSHMDLSLSLHLTMASWILLKYFIDYTITVVPIFPPLLPSAWFPPSLLWSLYFSSCPWVVHVSSLESPSPILFLTSPCLFCTYPIMLLNPYTFTPFFPFPLPAGNPPNDLHIYESSPVLVVCFCLCFLDSVVDSCEFIVILICIVLIFFFLNKFL